MVRRYSCMVFMGCLGFAGLQAQEEIRPNEQKNEVELKKSVENLQQELQQAVTQLKEIAIQETEKLKTDATKVVEKQKTKWPGLRVWLESKTSNIPQFPLWLALIMFFMMGVFASFTPCIYPMIPITLGILQSQASKSLGRNFLLSTSYVMGMAMVYAGLGYLAATSGLIFGEWLSNPWLIGFLILLFIYLAFSMFGFYEIYMPRFMQRGTQMQVKGSLLYSFLFGAASGTVASPCLSPALAIMISFVAKVGNPFVGFISFFAFALGMGVLLILIGTFSNTLTALPRAGMWMNEIKKIFGFLLIAVSIYYAKPFIGIHLKSILNWVLLAVVVGYYGWAFFGRLLKKTE